MTRRAGLESPNDSYRCRSASQLVAVSASDCSLHTKLWPLRPAGRGPTPVSPRRGPPDEVPDRPIVRFQAARGQFGHQSTQDEVSLLAIAFG